MDATIADDIQQHVTLALSRFGVATSPVLQGNDLVLLTTGAETRAPMAELAERWDSLGDEQRKRHCNALARKLTQKRREQAPPLGAARRKSKVPLLATGLVLLVAGVYWLSPYGPGTSSALDADSPIPARQAKPSAETTQLTARDERAERVCNATRLRVLRGATVSPMDVEGWVAEIALIRPQTEKPWNDLKNFVSIRNEIEDSRITWSKTPKLVKLDGYSTGLQLARSTYPRGNSEIEELVLTFYGSYVKAYFQERSRIQLVRLAQAMAKSYEATLGAIYGRCRSSSSHHLGSWFMGASSGGAAASLMYFMGATAQPAYLPPSLLTPQPGGTLAPAFASQQLQTMTRDLTRSTLAGWIGSQDGMVAGRNSSSPTAPGFVSIQFPFVDSNRAQRASRSVYGNLRAKADK